MTPGQRGEPVRDLQRRLAAAGYRSATAEAGVYCADTVAAVREFQEHRGLHATGCCDENTWRALVEATWKLGDRFLVLSSPNLRGDDVAELQSALGRLGFDSGRVDGIFGPRTARALVDFQSNCGIATDGVCGTETVRVLRRVSAHSGTGPGVATVREQEKMRGRAPSLTALPVVVGHFGGLGAIAGALRRDLRNDGADVLALDEPDPLSQSEAANRFGADVYVGLEAGTDDTSVVHFYRVPAFDSIGGRLLAGAVTRSLRDAGLVVADPCGMRLPILRETRMPAVLCRLAPVRPALDRSTEVASSLVSALKDWVAGPSLTVT